MSGKMTKQEFYNKIEEWISGPKEKWNHVTLVAYFFHKYHQKNGIQFTPARWSGNPASTKECKDISKVFKTFAPDNYSDLPTNEKKRVRLDINKKVYNYINWTFDYKHRYGDKGVAVTTQFLLAPYALNEFQIMYNRAMKKASSRSKIEDLVSWCKEKMPEILEIHQIEKTDDIMLIHKYADMYNLPSTSNERLLVTMASKMGIT